MRTRQKSDDPHSSTDRILTRGAKVGRPNDPILTEFNKGPPLALTATLLVREGIERCDHLSLRPPVARPQWVGGPLRWAADGLKRLGLSLFAFGARNVQLQFHRLDSEDATTFDPDE